LADVLGVVEGLDVLAGARDGDAVEQFEEVEVQRVQDGSRCSLLWWKLCPCVEVGLRTTEYVLYRLAGAQLLAEVLGVTLVGQCQLIAQVIEAVVHRSGRKHQHLGFKLPP